MGIIAKSYTNREYINEFCTIADMSVINMLCQEYFKNTVGLDAPLFAKEQALEKWFDSTYDIEAWSQARYIDKQRNKQLMEKNIYRY